MSLLEKAKAHGLKAPRKRNEKVPIGKEETELAIAYLRDELYLSQMTAAVWDKTPHDVGWKGYSFVVLNLKEAIRKGELEIRWKG